jgi:hypothetical protein
MAKASSLKSLGRVRADGRRSLLVYLRKEVIKKLKIAALDEDRPAYEITEEAVSEWLAAREQGRKRKK